MPKRGNAVTSQTPVVSMTTRLICLITGDRVFVQRDAADDNNPLWGGNSFSGFTGFLMKPAN